MPADALRQSAQHIIDELASLLERIPTFGFGHERCADVHDVIAMLKVWTGNLGDIEPDQRSLELIHGLLDNLAQKVVAFHGEFDYWNSGHQTGTSAFDNGIGQIRHAIQTLHTSIELVKPPHAQSSYERVAHYDQLFATFTTRLNSNTFHSQRINTFPIGQPAPFTEPVRLGDLSWLWSEVPSLQGLAAGSVDWHTNPDGLLFKPSHVDNARIVLSAFCDAWAAQTDPIGDENKLNGLKMMPGIVLILSVIKNGQRFLDHFVHARWEDRNLPFFHNSLSTVVRDQYMTSMILAQQYRIVRREWRVNQHLQCHIYEPLPLKPVEGLGRVGAFGLLDKVFDIGDNQSYARKIQNAVPGADEHWENEVNNLRQLSSESDKHHIVTFVKSYERGAEFGALLRPFAVTNLSRCLQHYCASHQVERERIGRVLLRAFGCLGFGLRYMHRFAHLRHRDIKPDNILFHENNTMKPGMHETEEFLWADFGLSHQFEPRCQTSTTQSLHVGTDEYRAPETDNRERHGCHSDIFSYGCVLLEIVNVLLFGTLNLQDPRSVLSLQPYRLNTPGIHDWIKNAKRSCNRDQTHLAKLLDVLDGMTALKSEKRPDIKVVVQSFRTIASKLGVRLFCSRCESYLDSEAGMQASSQSASSSQSHGRSSHGHFYDRLMESKHHHDRKGKGKRLD